MKSLNKVFLITLVVVYLSSYLFIPVFSVEEPSFTIINNIDIIDSVEDVLDTKLTKYQLITLYKASNVTEDGKEVAIIVPNEFLKRSSLRLYYLGDDGPIKVQHDDFIFNLTENGYYVLLDLKATSIKISQEPEIKKFPVNEKRDFKGMKILVTLDDDTTYETADYEIGETTIRDIFYDSVEVKYEGCTTILEVKVTPVGCGYATIHQIIISAFFALAMILIVFRRNKISY